MLARITKRIVREGAYWAFRAACTRLPNPPFDPGHVRKILVPAYAGIGNIVLYSPALRAIRRRFPDAELVLASGSSRSNDEVLGHEVVDRVLHVPLDAEFERRKADMRRLRAEGFDLLVSAFHCVYPYQAAFMAYARIPWRCGHVSSPGWRNPYDFLYNLPARMERDQYEVDRYLELAYAVGVDRGEVDRQPVVTVTEQAREAARALLTAAGFEPRDRYVVVHAGTSEVMRWKSWGVGRFRLVVEALAKATDLKFVLVGAPNEREEQAEMIDHLSDRLDGRFADAVGRTDIPGLAAIVDGAELLVGNDSGPMQLAVALGRPTVIPWGPSDLPRNAPRGAEHTVIFKHLPCSPCYHMPGDSGVQFCENHQCLEQISVDEVTAAALARL